jgi:hypothetical protein
MTDNNHESDRSGDSPGEIRHLSSFDPEADNVTEELVLAVETLDETATAEMGLLADSIDPDALGSLLRHRAAAPMEGTTTVQFQYDDYLVTVDSDGTLTLFNADTASHE